MDSCDPIRLLLLKQNATMLELLASENAKIQKLSQEVADAKAENDALRTKNQKCNAEIEEYSNLYFSLNTEHMELTNKYETLNSAYETLQKRNEELENKNAQDEKLEEGEIASTKEEQHDNLKAVLEKNLYRNQNILEERAIFKPRQIVRSPPRTIEEIFEEGGSLFKPFLKSKRRMSSSSTSSSPCGPPAKKAPTTDSEEETTQPLFNDSVVDSVS
ncbi:hypothetical protein L596_025749 [Steinernema carpocapsae]|uniref:Uncharacterized protein n=1 Tax=Steinernema carpocapsae TaxID=34508 RepID=A0A4U5M8P6_STECR|nr:hypothetical protein L596_025749 [Steinernema carpocapsae]